MTTKLIQVVQRVKELEVLGDEVQSLAERHYKGEAVLPELSVKGQRWYRGGRELLAQARFSGLKEFENCYSYSAVAGGNKPMDTDIETFINNNPSTIWKDGEYRDFNRLFSKARSLILALEQELLSRELPVVTQLSFAVAADEFDKAEVLFNESRGDEAILRASGVVARIALERHLFTVVEERGLSIIVNPPSKKKADVSDVLNTLVKANVITPVQKSQMDSLLAIANNCAHPKEAIRPEDVQRLIRDGRSAASVIL